ncbi:MAG: methionine adenosyltransferase [Bacteroidales bacterium]|nr:methionine adenosyltransferase [Bacteroidales bacterium]NLK81562.1 methionine adenosyltransferase [Bacteroidales bacterium]
MGYLFTSESVSEGHPDKVSDQISDALLDAFLAQDPQSKVACETLVTTGLIVLSGEVKTKATIDAQSIARRVVNEIGYNKAAYKFDGDSCGVISAIHEQSSDINQGVEREDPMLQGAGDQGMMFGYAVNETDNFMPLTLDISHRLLEVLADVRKNSKKMPYLRPDSKSQLTIEYDAKTHKPIRIDTIVISTQHDDLGISDADMQMKIAEDLEKYVISKTRKSYPARLRKLFDQGYKLMVNPTGKFVIGGPHGDTGLTGRKIIVDTYGGRGAHGGGAFSGKDSSKVDRSAAYACRHIAKNIVAAGVASECLVQVSYAIGVADPVNIYINTYGTSKAKRKTDGKKYTDEELGNIIAEMFDMRPASIVARFGLTNPIFLPTASYGHFGRDPYKHTVTVFSNGKEIKKEVDFFAWEKLDYVDAIKDTFF